MSAFIKSYLQNNFISFISFLSLRQELCLSERNNKDIENNRIIRTREKTRSATASQAPYLRLHRFFRATFNLLELQQILWLD